ncbi:MAG: trehalose-phosphatase [Candidatus Omnitrophota bacterium]|jgi:trehalose-phosphatase
MKYLFGQWQDVKKELEGRYILLLLDYDGTLVPIAEMPHKATLPEKTRDLLGSLSKSRNCKVAIVSGRSLKDIKKMVGLKGIVYSGNHGLEIEGPKIKFSPALPSGYKAALILIKNDLLKRVSKIKGALLEDKGLSLSLHYRLVAEKEIAKVKTAFREATILPRVKNKVNIRLGKRVLEVRPPVGWDKGKVALWLLARSKFALKGRAVMPVYVGDDLTDEDAFKALKSKGLTIFVGRSKILSAAYYLKDPKEAGIFLNYILEICRS